jgi:hypothetical protein
MKIHISLWKGTNGNKNNIMSLLNIMHQKVLKSKFPGKVLMWLANREKGINKLRIFHLEMLASA